MPTIGMYGLATALLIPSYRYYLFHGLPFQKKSVAEQYFSEDYYEARSKFREAVTQHPSKIELHTIQLDIVEEQAETVEGQDFTIDIGLLRRSKRHLIIHISGTHGVEGFAGSAAQLALLGPSSNPKVLDDDETKPTILFVHAMNAYGFAKLRRFNENNVDLNRNFMTEDEFKKVISQDPNHSRYVDFMDLMNPTESFAMKWDSFYLEAAVAIAKHGFKNLKKALVSGNYHFKKTIFFGGQELQQSHALLKLFLGSQLEIDEFEEVGVIDLHTGLGKSGSDTLAFHAPTTGGADTMKNIFGGKNGEFNDKITGLGQPTGKLSNDTKKKDAEEAMSGYGTATGFLLDGLFAQVFPSAARVYLLTQEFGTVPGVTIVKAMRAENTMYWYDRESRHPKFSEPLRDVFYLKNNPGWKTSIVSRGKAVFHQLHAHMCQ